MNPTRRAVFPGFIYCPNREPNASGQTRKPQIPSNSWNQSHRTVRSNNTVRPHSHAMSIHRFFLLSLALSVLAVGLHLAAMSQTSRGLRIRVQATAPDSHREAARVIASSYSKRGTILGYIALALALASVVSVIVSARRHEPSRRIIVYGVLTIYVMLQFVLI